jgi:hypothetical protein
MGGFRLLGRFRLPGLYIRQPREGASLEGFSAPVRISLLVALFISILYLNPDARRATKRLLAFIGRALSLAVCYIMPACRLVAFIFGFLCVGLVYIPIFLFADLPDVAKRIFGLTAEVNPTAANDNSDVSDLDLDKDVDVHEVNLQAPVFV